MNQSTSTVSWIVRAIMTAVLLVASLSMFTSAFAIPVDADFLEPSIGAASGTASGTETAQASASAGAGSAPVSDKGARIVASFTVFLLAVFVGVEVINKVPPTLHTPLMSGSNAISGITIIGALLTTGHLQGGFGSFLGMIATVLAMINVAGGFLVTHRMLMMFKKR